MSDLYTPEGWLNIEYLMDKPAWLIVIFPEWLNIDRTRMDKVEE